MKTRTFAFCPPAFAFAFIVIGLAAGTAALPWVLRTENELGKILSVAGCFAAAFAFEREDYLRRAWAFTGSCLLLLLVRDLTVIPAVDHALAWPYLETAQGVVVVVANASSVVGSYLLARAWNVAGLDDTGSRGRRWTLLAAGAAVSLVVTGWPLWHDAGLLLGGDLRAVAWVGSDVGDTLCFALVAPVLHTALALRGGALLGPWALLTAGGFCWILYDAGWGFGELLHVDVRPGVRLGVEAFRGLACTYVAAAGFAQRRAVRTSPA